MNNSNLFSFSIINNGDDKYSPLLENFKKNLSQLDILSDHKIFEVEGNTGRYNDNNFNSIVYEKLKYTEKKLKENKIVFCCDLDIIFLQDPVNYLYEQLSDCDIVFQNDNGRKCTGFFMAKPSSLTIDLFNIDNYKLKSTTLKCDQAYINEKLRDTKYSKLKIKVLDNDLFPNGDYWFNKHKKTIDPFVIHYNYLSNFKLKIQKIKQDNFWLI